MVLPVVMITDDNWCSEPIVAHRIFRGGGTQGERVDSFCALQSDNGRPSSSCGSGAAGGIGAEGGGAPSVLPLLGARRAAAATATALRTTTG